MERGQCTNGHQYEWTKAELEESPFCRQCGAPLSGDAAKIQEVLDRVDEELHLWHDLSHMIGVLQAIAAKDLPRP